VPKPDVWLARDHGLDPDCLIALKTFPADWGFKA